MKKAANQRGQKKGDYTMSIAQPRPGENIENTTEGLYRAFLQQRKEERKFAPGEMRLSEAGLCPRRQTLRMLGCEADETSLQQESIFRAGEEHEDAIYLLWASIYPRRVKRQVQVKWWGGIGHADIWVSPLKLLVESKSCKMTAKPYLPQDHHVAQVQLYLHFWGAKRGARAEIAYRLKQTGEILSFPIEYDPRRAAELEESLKQIHEAVRAGAPLAVPGEYRPSRFPCSWRTDDGIVRCGYFAHCWTVDAETTVKAKHVVTVTSLDEEMERYLQVVRDYGEAKERVKKLEAIKKHYEASFAPWLDERGADGLTAGTGVTVYRSLVKPYVTYDVKCAVAEGAIAEDVLEPYRTERGGGAKWSVKIEKGGNAA